MPKNRSSLAQISAAALRGGRMATCAFLCLASLAAAANSDAPTYVTFEVPGAGARANQGTFARTINVTGSVTGSYTDPDNVTHGFVRAASGVISTFDPPLSIITLPFAINDE